jgi:phosphopantothenoylcysteine decarboxylase/phosphopantothenate--cysteine ligase
MARPAAEVVLGVGGGIAAYKSCLLLRTLSESGLGVTVVPTQASLHFVGAATWEALSGRPARHDVFDDVPAVPHVALGRTADLVVVAPATADLLARTAHGLAGDLLGNVLLTATCPVLLVPAMHTEMWLNPATRTNVETLRGRGITVMEPSSGRLTGADSGVGRLPEPDDIAAAVRQMLGVPGPLPRDLDGRRVVVTAGGTREYLDPVRFIGNRSSGRQGWALARAAALRGADVTLVTGPTEMTDPAGITTIRVTSAEQLREETLNRSKGAAAVVMAAAVADFRPSSRSAVKIKKTADPSHVPDVELVRNPDVLAELSDPGRPGRSEQVVVGFAAETGGGERSVLELGQAKLAAKGCDLLVVNRVGDGYGFEQDENEAVLLGTDGWQQQVPMTSKDVLARHVWDAVADRLRVS